MDVIALMDEIAEHHPLECDHAEDGRYTWPARWALLRLRGAAQQLAEADNAGRLREAAEAVVSHSTPLMDGTLIARTRAARDALVNLRAALGIAA